MASYKVIFSPRANTQLQEIIEDPEPFGYVQTLAYLEELEELCLGLGFMPYKFKAEEIDGHEYRTLTYKGHKLFYRVSEELQTVYIDGVFGKSQLPKF